MSELAIESYALLFHSSVVNNKRNTSVSSHPVTIRENNFVVGAGRNVSSEDQAKIANVLIESLDTSLTMFPSTVLARSLDSLVWYRPSKPALMRFMLEGEVVEITRIAPSLIFKLSKGQLFVACFKGKSRPKHNTPLYRAPFGNINSGTRMCLGSNRVPTHPNLHDMDYVERLFFESEFTALHETSSLQGISDFSGMVAFYEGLGDKKTFPMNVVSPLKTNGYGRENVTVEEWIEK